MEMVDPDNLLMSDFTWNMYGFEGNESEHQHNLIQTNIVRALAEEVRGWANKKVERPSKSA